MKQPNEIRQALIDGTVRVVARNGLDKATTKALSTEAGVNEVNIYRMFDGKEDLLVKTFAAVDNELVTEVLSHLPIMDMPALPIEYRCRALFFFVWRYLTGNSEKCRFFVRYYYSPYFEKFSAEEHKKNYSLVLEKFTPAFKEGVDVWVMLVHILDVMLSSAIKVHQQEMPDTEETAERVFNLLYSALEQHLS